MERLTNTERKYQHARNAVEAGLMSSEKKISPYETSFAGKGNTSREAVCHSFTVAARKQLSGRQG